jgi:hypothetical protein
LHSERPEE